MLDVKAFTKDVAELIGINSVEGEKSAGAPFGEGVKTALLWFLSKAQSFGFKTINYDNYAGEIVFGEGQEIGIIGHLDVVPVGSGWSYPPFTLTEKDGYFIGRGVGDDKGAMLMTLYALKALKESGAPCYKKFRFFVGCNEESAWKDVAYLKTKTALPEYGFSPDGNFPVSYAEKGFYYIKVKVPPFKNFGAITGGTVINAVCAHAEISAKTDFDKTLLAKHGLKYENGKIISEGVSAHGSKPQLGKNALLPLFKFLQESGEDVGDIIDYLFNDKWGVSKMHNEQGYVTFSPDLAEPLSDGGTLLSCDCRIPAPFTVADVKAKFDLAPFKVEIIDHDHPPFMTDKNGAFVTALLNAYNGVTGEKESPVSMGGSTFARVFKKGCAFGPEFANENYHMHEADERVKISSFFKTYEIYEKSLRELASIKEDL